MKYIAILIGILFTVSLQAQNNTSYDSFQDSSITKKAKISKKKSGYGITKERELQTMVREIVTVSDNQASDIIEAIEAKPQSTTKKQKQVRRSYHKVGFKVDNTQSEGIAQKATTVLE